MKRILIIIKIIFACLMVTWMSALYVLSARIIFWEDIFYWWYCNTMTVNLFSLMLSIPIFLLVGAIIIMIFVGLFLWAVQ